MIRVESIGANTTILVILLLLYIVLLLYRSGVTEGRNIGEAKQAMPYQSHPYIHRSNTWDNSTRRRGTSVVNACFTRTRTKIESRYDVLVAARCRLHTPIIHDKTVRQQYTQHKQYSSINSSRMIQNSTVVV